MSPATFYFDLGSPYAYLAAERLAVAARWQPIALGGLWKRNGRASWARTPRRALGMAEIEARARAYGLPPVRWPDGWPGNMLAANRAALVAGEQGRGEAFARTAFRAAFADGRDLSALDEVLAVAAACGVEDVAARIADPTVKQALIDATDAAHDAGVFGVPTLALGGRLFWGDDQLELAEAAAG